MHDYIAISVCSLHYFQLKFPLEKPLMFPVSVTKPSQLLWYQFYRYYKKEAEKINTMNNFNVAKEGMRKNFPTILFLM